MTSTVEKDYDGVFLPGTEATVYNVIRQSTTSYTMGYPKTTATL
ncbi:unnamed protein product, partial [Didymodactylos carnosus]